MQVFRKCNLDIQIGIPKVHPIYISSRSEYWITTDIMCKHTKNAEKRPSPKNRGLVPTILPEPDFSPTYVFRKVLDNVEVTTYMKFQNIFYHWMQRCRKKLQKYPQNGGCPLCHFCTLMLP